MLLSAFDHSIPKEVKSIPRASAESSLLPPQGWDQPLCTECPRFFCLCGSSSRDEGGVFASPSLVPSWAAPLQMSCLPVRSKWVKSNMEQGQLVKLGTSTSLHLGREHVPLGCSTPLAFLAALSCELWTALGNIVLDLLPSLWGRNFISPLWCAVTL